MMSDLFSPADTPHWFAKFVESPALLASHESHLQGDTLDLDVLAQSLMLSTKPVERFSVVPEVLFEQAQRIEVWHLPADAEGQGNHLLVFAQDTKTNDVVDGCEVAAYPCDNAGRVTSWVHRYTERALNLGMATQKLRYKVINGLAELQLVENL